MLHRPLLAALLIAGMPVHHPAASTDPALVTQAAAARDRSAVGTWMLASNSQFRLPPPPDAAATGAELEQLRGVAEGRSEAEARIAWWNAAAPAYRWNQIALEEAVRAGLNVNFASRHLALLHAALDDAMAAAWDSKAAHGRPRPTVLDASFRAAIPTPASPSYPDEHAVAGAVAAAVLGAALPQRAAYFAGLAEEAARMRLVSGVSFPSDVAAGVALGRQVAAVALERGRGDGSDRPWAGRVPDGPGRWGGTNPIVPQAATWRPWLLSAPDEFRPPPPPAHDSPEHAAEMAGLRAYQRTPRSNAGALFWEVAVGGLRNFEYWNLHADRLLMEYGRAADPLAAARALALLNVAIYDSGIACWDAKYAYWRIRPFQFDPEFRTVFATPNHPSYPAAHACFSMASARVLGHLFPGDAAALLALGRESGESRVWAGIHYPSDVTAGQVLGDRVAARVIERMGGERAGR